MRYSGWRGLLRRGVTLLGLVAFMATSPGLGLTEIGAHILDGRLPGHVQGAHFEEAGYHGHADHCDLGLPLADGRLVSSPSTRVHVEVGPLLRTPTTSESAFAPPPAFRGFPRAPPSRAI